MFLYSVFINFLRMKYIFVYLLLILFVNGNIANAQKVSDSIGLRIESLYTRNDSMNISIALENMSSKALAIFKPSIEYVNYGLIAINLISIANQSKFEYYHGNRGDIDNIFLTEQDYIIIDKGETYTKRLKLAIKEFSPKIKRGQYKLEILLDYSLVHFTFPCKIETKIFDGKARAISNDRINPVVLRIPNQ